MTQEQKNIKIAEVTGKIGPLCPIHHSRTCCGREPIPDYFSDLNAMHDAVMSQPIDVRTNFRKELQWMVAPNTKPGRACSSVLMNAEQYDAWFFATAAQRAEAFGKTLNLW